jgi:ElaB/YqjD/DUF883 family membrane-anchored ribosome-binding protein
MINRIGNQRDFASGAGRREDRIEPSAESKLQVAAQEAVSQAGGFVAAHPVAALSVAVVVGITIGWWVKRR